MEIIKLLCHRLHCFGVFAVFAALAMFVWSLDAAIAAQVPPVQSLPPDELPPQIQILQPGVKLTLLAEHPDLVTPTGLDVDANGNIWVVASHTHFRPKDYEGPDHDEILVFSRNGKNRQVFYNKTDMTMNIKLGHDGWVYLALRTRILRVKDTDGDGHGDIEENLAVLETKADYPHNGLSGMAWLPGGELLFSAGTNSGETWTLEGRDGRKLSGRGEGGVFRCAADGTGMRSIARGFWNPFGLLVRNDGEMFAIDNDAGSHPPCRLLNIIEGADYGYQRVYGNAPVHPFVGWNGELRGTLGMIHPVSEGPCAVVELGGGVMVPSWSSHCIDYFPLARKGAGYVSERVELLRGGDFFRPAFLTPGPDGSFYLTDWVLSSYPVHGRGRLWKLEIDRTKATWVQSTTEPVNPSARLAKELRENRVKLSPSQLFEHARGPDATLSDAALTALARESAPWTPQSVRALADKDRVWALVALRRVDLYDEKWVRQLLNDSDPEVRFECLRWIADAVFTSLSADVERMLTHPDLDYRLFEAILATMNTLRGKPAVGISNAEWLLEHVTNSVTPARLKGYALRLVPASHPTVSVPLLRELLAMADPTLSLEVVRTLAARNGDEATAMLAEIAATESYTMDLRSEAIAGLAASSKSEHQAQLLQFASHPIASLREESLRALRQSQLDDAAKESLKNVAHLHPESKALVNAIFDPASMSAGRPSLDDTAAWLERLDTLPGIPNVEAGRRIFHSTVSQCAACHRHSGRGNVKGIGPDMSFIARQGDRKSLLRSILEPSREVAPEFYPTVLLLENGTVFTGILLSSADDEIYLDLAGKEHKFQLADIVERKASKTSLMPTGLVNSLTDGELRNLIAFLRYSSSPSLTADEPQYQKQPNITKFFEVPKSYEGDFGEYRSIMKFDDGSPVRSTEDWLKRRQEILKYWHKAMGPWPALLDQPRIEYLETIHVENFTRHKVQIEVAANVFDGPQYLLIPDGEGPFPAVVVNWYNSSDSAGVTDRALLDFGYQLTKRGFVTLCIGGTDGANLKQQNPVRIQPLSYLAYTAANCSNLLACLPQVDANRIGIIGHSFGGKWAMFASCLHDRFACAVWIDPGIMWNEKDPNANYWEKWYLGYEFSLSEGSQRVPGVVTPDNGRTGAYQRLVGEGRDLHELHALMAPRPFLVSGGAQDRPGHWTALNHSIAVNKLLGYTDRVAMTMRAGHAPTPESNQQAFLFLEHFLRR